MADYKILTIPFARDAVPDMVNDIPNDPSISEPQLASFKQGFPSITTIPLVAGGIPPEGQDFNGILRDITEHIVHQNKGGMYKFEAEVVAAGGYPSGAVLAANDGLSLWVSLVDANVEDFNSGTPEQWARIAFSGLDALLNNKLDKSAVVQTTGTSTTNVMSQKAVTDVLAGVDKINGPIATVAAATNINLTTGAPDTSQLLITGSGVNIANFTVAANRFFVAKFSGANTLVNSASIVTGTGANIQADAGDSFLMRATAANTVEIVGYTRAEKVVSSFGATSYRKTPKWFDGGTIEAWGTSTTVSAGRVVVTLPLAMADVNYDVQITSKQTTPGSGFAVETNSTIRTTSSFEVYGIAAGAGIAANGVIFSWRVIGKAP